METARLILIYTNTEVPFKKFVSKKNSTLYDRMHFNSQLSSVSLLLNRSLNSGYEVGCYNMSVLTAARLRCVVVYYLRHFVAALLSFPPFICMQDQPHFTAWHNVKNAENINVDFCFWLIDKQKLGCICSRLTELKSFWHHSVKL